MFPFGIIRWFKKFEYKAVASLPHRIQWTNLNDRIETITYVCKENGFGKRKVEIHDYGYAKIYKIWRTTSLYVNTIIPWLNHLPGNNMTQTNPPGRSKKQKVDKKKGNVVYLKKDR